jgi:hypothetical protein
MMLVASDGRRSHTGCQLGRQREQLGLSGRQPAKEGRGRLAHSHYEADLKEGCLSELATASARAGPFNQMSLIR